MKKIVKYVICLSAIVLMGSINVKANDDCLCTPGDNLCELNGCRSQLFGVLGEDGDEVVISTASPCGIDENQNYGSFEIRDREIYLNNSIIDELYIIQPWALLDYKIHVTGTNKIKFLDNFNYPKYEYPDTAAAYPEVYSKDFIPITVEGDGTLEIEAATQIQKNSNGENYYGWSFNYWAENKEGRCMGSYVGRLVSDCDWDKPACKNEVFTKSEIRQKFIEDKMQLGVRGKYLNPLYFHYGVKFLDMDNQADRETWIDELLSEEPTTQTCNYERLIPQEPSIGGFQLTRDFGEEYIITDMARSFTETGSYLLSPKEENPIEEPVEELETVTTTQAGGIVFESIEPFDSNYHLGISDITDNLTDEEASKIEAKTDKVLIKLYDINMLDKDDNIVDMGIGEYTIKIALDDILKKYEKYEVLYIDEEGKVTLLNTEVEGDYIVFKTSHLSKYGIVGSEIRKTGNIVNPNTADNIVAYELILCGLIISIALVVLRINKLKKANF